MNSKYSNFKNYIIYILLIVIFLISFFQMFSQHWSSHFDTDWFNIYNILLIKSGYVQDFYDHPAFTIYFINHIILSLYDIFNPNLKISIDGAFQAKNLNEFFEKIFIIARIANALLHCGTVYLLSKILDLLNKDKFTNIILLIILVLSNFFYVNLFQIRPEIASVFFFLLATFLVIKKDNNFLNLRNYIISGFLIGFSYISKIQIIFFIFFLIFMIPLIPIIFKDTNEYKNLIVKSKFFKMVTGAYFFICIIYILIEYFIIYKHPRYIDHAKIDLYGFFLFNIFYFIFIKIFSGNNINLLRVNITRYILLFFGFLSSALFLSIINLVNLIPVNHNIYFKYLNPYYFLSNRSFDGTLFEFISTFLKIDLLIENIIFILSIFLFLPFIKTFAKKNNFMVLISLGLVILYILSNNLRYYYLYEIYTFIAFIFLFAFTYKKNLTKYRYFITLVLLMSTIYNSFLVNNFKDYFNRESAFKNCNNEKWILLKSKKGLDEWTPWTKKFDKSFYYKICKDIN